MKRIALALLLASPTAASANSFSDDLAKLSESGRKAMFQNYMKTARRQCDAVTRVYFQGVEKPDTDFWNVECDRSKTWSIRLFPTGKTAFYPCNLMAAGQKCWKPLATRDRK